MDYNNTLVAKVSCDLRTDLNDTNQLVAGVEVELMADMGG